MVDIFRDLSEAEVHEIDRATTITSAHRGKILYMPEETGEVLFMLKEGRVQLYRISPEGKKLVIATIGPGTVFGEMAFIGQGMHNSFAEALEECVLLIMSRTDVEHLLVTKPQVALRIVEVLGRRLQEAETRLAEIAFKSIPARLASLLLQLAEEQGRQAATLLEIVGQCPQNGFHQTLSHPMLEATVASLVWRISLGQILPRRTSPENPKGSIQHFARVPPRLATLAPGTSFLFRNERLDYCPLFVCQIHCSPCMRKVSPLYTMIDL